MLIMSQNNQTLIRLEVVNALRLFKIGITQKEIVAVFPDENISLATYSAEFAQSIFNNLIMAYIDGASLVVLPENEISSGFVITQNSDGKNKKPLIAEKERKGDLNADKIQKP